MQPNDGYFEAYWPRAPRQQRRRTLSPRLDTLEGKTIAQLWDYLFKGDEVFALLEAGLKARYPGIRFISRKEFGNTHRNDEKEVLAALPQKLHASDDPNRLVPIVVKPDDYMIAVSGDPLRNNAYIFAHNGYLGYPTGKKINLPPNWEKMLAERK